MSKQGTWLLGQGQAGTLPMSKQWPPWHGRYTMSKQGTWLLYAQTVATLAGMHIQYAKNSGNPPPSRGPQRQPGASLYTTLAWKGGTRLSPWAP